MPITSNIRQSKITMCKKKWYDKIEGREHVNVMQGDGGTCGWRNI